MNKGWFMTKCVLWGLIAVFLIGAITMLLWNWLVPELFNGPRITYFQAVGLLVLCKILFGGFGKHHGPSPSTQAPYWKQRFQDKFATLDPQEKEAFKQKMKEKWCSWEKRADEANEQH